MTLCDSSGCWIGRNAVACQLLLVFRYYAGSDRGVSLVRPGRLTSTRTLAIHHQCFGHKKLARSRSGTTVIRDYATVMMHDDTRHVLNRISSAVGNLP